MQTVLESIVVRRMRESDLAEADRIFRLAFGTFIGLPEPLQFAAGCDFIRHRWQAAPGAVFAAELNGRLIGSNIASRWGSFAFFGPLTVAPDLWGRGVAGRLLTATMDLFAQWQIQAAGLFTFAQSARHVGLYQKFNFWPRFLTAIMSKPAPPSASSIEFSEYSKLSSGDQRAALDACRELADRMYPGLDLSREILAVHQDQLGDTVLVWDDSKLDAFAVCHAGTGTEAGPDTCYVKFGGVRPEGRAEGNFGRLLEACETLAHRRGLRRVLAGVSTASHQAYRELLRRGFRTEIQGVAMHRDNDPVFYRPEIFALGDWR